MRVHAAPSARSTFGAIYIYIYICCMCRIMEPCATIRLLLRTRQRNRERRLSKSTINKNTELQRRAALEHKHTISYTQSRKTCIYTKLMRWICGTIGCAVEFDAMYRVRVFLHSPRIYDSEKDCFDVCATHYHNAHRTHSCAPMSHARHPPPFFRPPLF